MKNIFKHASTLRIPCNNGNNLLWREDIGIGYLKSNGCEYGDDYWKKYLSYAISPIAIALNKARIDFVKRYYPLDDSSAKMLCDIGIGNGDFVKETGCVGFDVNPNAVKWLKEFYTYGSPYVEKYSAITLWDVLEHIDEPGELLNDPKSAPYLFTSLPIHSNLNECLYSKHLRPDEHIWHFTQTGLIHFMSHYGYYVVEINDSETSIGRESIGSFHFRKRS